MEFLKKNWGLLLCAVAFIVLMAIELKQIFSYKEMKDANEKRVDQAQTTKNNINSAGWNILLTEKNVHGDDVLVNAMIAANNQGIAEEHSNDLHNELIKRFSFQPALPKTDGQAKDELDKRLSKLTDTILNNKVEWNCATPIGGLFYVLARQSAPIPTSDFPNIFRQLVIYEKLIQIIVNSGVKTINTLEFPRGLVVEEESEYTVTPIIISVEGDEMTIQKLVNNFSLDPTMLFVIRNMNFIVPTSNSPAEEFYDIVLQRRAEIEQRQEARLNAANSNNERMGGMGMGMGGMGMGMGGMGMDDMSPRVMGMGGTGSMDGQNIDSNALVYEPPKRQDYLVFRTPRRIQINLTLDLLEFKSSGDGTEEDEEEDDS